MTRYMKRLIAMFVGTALAVGCGDGLVDATFIEPNGARSAMVIPESRALDIRRQAVVHGYGYKMDCGFWRDPIARPTGEVVQFSGQGYAGQCVAIGPSSSAGSQLGFSYDEPQWGTFANGNPMDNSVRSAKGRGPTSGSINLAWNKNYSFGGGGYWRTLAANQPWNWPTWEDDSSCPGTSTCQFAPHHSTSSQAIVHIP